MEKLNFQQRLLLSSVSQDPSEIILICLIGSQDTFLLLSMLKKVVVLNIFGFFDKWRFIKWNEISEEQHLFKIELFCNIIKVYNVTFVELTFDQFKKIEFIDLK